MNEIPSAPSRTGVRRSDRLGQAAFALSVLSVLIYLSTSLGVRNFIILLIEGGAKAIALFGLAR